jgi:hypothetical protein
MPPNEERGTLMHFIDVDQETAREALNVVLNELRSHRNPAAMIQTIGTVDLELIIEVLDAIYRLWSYDASSPPF